MWQEMFFQNTRFFFPLFSLGINETGPSSLSQTHLPGYVEDYEKIKAKGVDIIVCVSVNDPFVMEAWGESKGATGKIRMLADPAGEFTKVSLQVQANYLITVDITTQV